MSNSKTIIKNLSTLGLIYIFILTLSGMSIAQAAWTDEFTSINYSRWDWNYNRGTGYKRLTTIDTVSVAEIGITDQSHHQVTLIAHYMKMVINILLVFWK